MKKLKKVTKNIPNLVSTFKMRYTVFIYLCVTEHMNNPI